MSTRPDEPHALPSVTNAALGMNAPNRIGEVLLKVEDVTLSFGGVTALSGVSLEVRRGEICAIIGPNGAGKSSLLNVLNGVYHPHRGLITFQGIRRRRMNPHETAKKGIARTFQNIALFKGMSVLENILTGRALKMRSNLFAQALYWGPGQKEEIAHRRRVEQIIDFLQIQAVRKTPAGRLPYGLQKRVELARALAAEPVLLLLHGGRDGPFRPPRCPRLRPQDRRRHPGPGPRRFRCHRRVPRSRTWIVRLRTEN